MRSGVIHPGNRWQEVAGEGCVCVSGGKCTQKHKLSRGTKKKEALAPPGDPSSRSSHLHRWSANFHCGLLSSHLAAVVQFGATALVNTFGHGRFSTSGVMERGV